MLWACAGPQHWQWVNCGAVWAGQNNIAHVCSKWVSPHRTAVLPFGTPFGVLTENPCRPRSSFALLERY